VKQFFVQRWFLITLVAVLAIGTCLCHPLQTLSEMKPLRDGIVAAVLFLMALPLEASAMWRSMRRPGPPLLAVLVTFGLLPLFAWGVSKGLEADLGAGLLVAAVTPCTLASASVWTRRAGGNDTVSILVTVSTNLFCFLVTPLWLGLMMADRVAASDLKEELEFGAMAIKLALLVVLPMTVAQLLRLHKPFAAWATGQKATISVLAQCGILAMVLLGAINVGLRLQDSSQPSLNLVHVAVMLVAVCLVHVAMLYAGVAVAKLLRFTREDQIAIAFSGSQKTLTVGLLVAMSLGVSILPMVWYHISQLFIDTLIADRYRAAETKVDDAHVAPRPVV
jgi:sodium/bile acid cotransporter 7